MPPSRRDDLIDAAMRVFHRHGFRATCLDKVLQEGGISRMTLYNHFKSKDDLIVAALRRGDEMLRLGLMKFIEARASDPVGRLLAVFDFLEQWFGEAGFCGCMFINACAEFDDPASPVRRVVADHKREVRRAVRALCAEAGLADADAVADQLAILIEGAIVTAHVHHIDGADARPEDAARRAKQVAKLLIDAARSAVPS